MTEERTLPDFMKYQYGALAARLAISEESSRYMPGALEMLVGAKGLDFGEDAEAIVHGWRESLKKGEQTAVLTSINDYNQKFNEKRGEYKPVELTSGWYAPVLNSIDKEDADKIVRYLGKYDETLSAITKKHKKAAKIVEDSKDKDLKESYTPEQISEANETVKKYNDVLGIIQALDRYSFENLRPDVVKATRKQELKGLASQL